MNQYKTLCVYLPALSRIFMINARSSSASGLGFGRASRIRSIRWSVASADVALGRSALDFGLACLVFKATPGRPTDASDNTATAAQRLLRSGAYASARRRAGGRLAAGGADGCGADGGGDCK